MTANDDSNIQVSFTIRKSEKVLWEQIAENEHRSLSAQIAFELRKALAKRKERGELIDLGQD